MSERAFKQLAGLAVAITALAAACAVKPNPALALGIAIGGCWGLANLWCLSRMLVAWLGTHSRRRAIGWLVVKLAALYPLAVVILSANPHVAPGFGLGFGLALIVMIAGIVRSVRRPATFPAHGR